MNTYRTAQVAAIIGIRPNTVRLYEELELILKPERKPNGYRVFTDFHIEQFRLARLALQVEVLQNGLRKNILQAVKASAIPRITEKTVLLGGLLVMSVIRSFGAGVQTPAVNAVIPQLVPEDQIMRFNDINATMQSVVQFAAPAAAGALLTVSTLRSTLIIDIATAIAGIGLLSAVLIPKQAIQSTEASVLNDMKTGIKYTLSDKLIGKVLTVYGFFIFLCVPAGFLSQLFVSRVYGETYWYLTAVKLAGFIEMVAGGLLMSTWGGFKSRVKTMFVGLIAFGSLAIGMGLSKQFVLYLALMKMDQNKEAL